MNNGDNTNQLNNNQQTSMEMSGVKIVPPQEGPVNASNSATATSAPKSDVLPSTTTINQTPTNPIGIAPIVAPTPVEPTSNSDTIPPVVVPNPVDPTPNSGSTPPVITPPTMPNTTPIEPPQQQPIKEKNTPPKEEKKGLNIIPILILIIIGLGLYIVYTNKAMESKMTQLSYNCTPISTQEEIELDINSTLVQDLYSKVFTTIREDYANPYFDEEMKLYLAYRQVTEKEKYDSNCNLFSTTSMEPFTCEVSANFQPKAFKEDSLKREYKKLFGENTYFEYKNIQLGNTCLIGYQYIAQRGEYVEGYCNKKTATSYKVNKALTSATSRGNTIILTEDVKYKAAENMDLPSYLRSGTYRYTFRLDLNYNYILISKTYESKY